MDAEIGIEITKIATITAINIEKILVITKSIFFTNSLFLVKFKSYVFN
jgi:hypothetical protein